MADAVAPPTCVVQHYLPNPANEGDGTFQTEDERPRLRVLRLALPAPVKGTGAPWSGAVLVNGTNAPLCFAR